MMEVVMVATMVREGRAKAYSGYARERVTRAAARSWELERSSKRRGKK